MPTCRLIPEATGVDAHPALFLETGKIGGPN